jgi:hypothetical protein
MNDKPNRHWYTFSIRDLILVTAVIVLTVGWLADRRHQETKVKPLIKAQKDAEARFSSLRSLVELDGSEVVWVQKEDDLRMSIVQPPSSPNLVKLSDLKIKRKPRPQENMGDFATPPPSLKKSLEMDRPPSFRRAP